MPGDRHVRPIATCRRSTPTSSIRRGARWREPWSSTERTRAPFHFTITEPAIRGPSRQLQDYYFAVTALPTTASTPPRLIWCERRYHSEGDRERPQRDPLVPMGAAIFTVNANRSRVVGGEYGPRPQFSRIHRTHSIGGVEPAPDVPIRTVTSQELSRQAVGDVCSTASRGITLARPSMIYQIWRTGLLGATDSLNMLARPPWRILGRYVFEYSTPNDRDRDVYNATIFSSTTI